MLVLKFGGTSVGSPGAVSKLVSILKDPDHRGKTKVVVVSALAGITDSLIQAARYASGQTNRGSAAAGEGFIEKTLGNMLDRHLEIGAAFLDEEEQRAARAGIESSLTELSRMLEGVGMLGELSLRSLDGIMSFGERLSAPLAARILQASGMSAEYLDSRDMILTDGNYGAARFIPAETFRRIRKRVGAAPGLFVASGFVASAEDGSATTLGRGGSDLSAAIYGAALDAEGVEIWTDVDGFLTADPRLVKSAFLIDSVSYEEAMELTHFGAKVLHPPTIKPALEKNIPIIIRNTFNPSCPGTRITRNAGKSEYPIRGISSLSRVTLVRLQGSGMVGAAGFFSRFFGVLARRKISVILVSQGSSEYSICVALDPIAGTVALEGLREEFHREIGEGTIDDPLAEEDLSIVAVVGEKMKRVSGISGKVFHALGRNGINVAAIAQGSSEINISLVVAAQDEAKALNAIHEAFFLSGIRSVNLFLLGSGLIGGTLLDQLSVHREILADTHKIRISLAGAGNSRGMLFNAEGLDPLEVKSLLRRGAVEASSAETPPEKSGKPGDPVPFSLDGFIETMKAYNLPNTAFCDCTASGEVAAAYEEIITHAIPIVTPNKRANAGSYGYYKTLTAYSRERGIPYLYETTVCAGLPVISTLRDLFLSGDRVRRIEAVLSGTLSYIFNNFNGEKPFSTLVREARAAGYTEPDPRDDLNAMDAARKALILARECGMQLEFEKVEIEPLLAPACFEASGVDAFFCELENSDAAFEERRFRAAAKGRALRYVAVIEDGRAKLALRGEEEGSPFRTLKDSDNMVAITSDRYSRLPMVIKGPGAGAQVTAGGVFADIVRIARTLV
ncbi:MAG: bifunctional aspartate kinase/homoserine dehydrogenase I [Treponema sp.]|jgi:aspartokinase/homoserine dehydrogenase 1|nr:bifunctional aspartate kinase/homoserine dehydrogenase I [Treponema sp.]